MATATTLNAVGRLLRSEGDGLFMHCTPEQTFRLDLTSAHAGEMYEDITTRDGNTARGVLRRIAGPR